MYAIAANPKRKRYISNWEYISMTVQCAVVVASNFNICLIPARCDNCSRNEQLVPAGQECNAETEDYFEEYQEMIRRTGHRDASKNRPILMAGRLCIAKGLVSDCQTRTIAYIAPPAFCAILDARIAHIPRHNAKHAILRVNSHQFTTT